VRSTTTLLLTLVLGLSGCTERHPAVVRLLPDGIEEEPLELGRVSRMAFSPPAEGQVHLRFRCPHDGSSLWLGCGLTGKRGSATFRAWLRSSAGDSQLVFNHTAAPGKWFEGVVDLSSCSGRAVELVLHSKQRGVAATAAYWATPTMVAAEVDRPSVLLICIDSLRADHLGCYGYSRSTSPTLDSLASRGCLFSRAIAQSSWTLPSHASLFTSLYVKSHGVDSGRTALRPDADTLAEILRRNGYLTAAFVTAPTLTPQFGLAQGFDLYDARCSGRDAAEIYGDRTNPCVHRGAVQWLRRWGNAPFFIFLHYWDVHFDYNPPAPYDTLFDPEYRGTFDGKDFLEDDRIRPGLPARDLEHLVALYDGEIAHTDRYLGMLFAEIRRLGLGANTHVIVTSDHGDEFLEHGAKGHGHTLFQELIHVPLIWVEAGRNSGPATVERPVRAIDIGPTILDLLGLSVPPTMEGRSLVGLMRHQAREQTLIFAELSAIKGTRERLSAALFGESKVIRSALTGELRAYDLKSDAGELHPLEPEQLDHGSALREALTRFLGDESLRLEVRVVGTGGKRFLLKLTSADSLTRIDTYELEPNDWFAVTHEGRSVELRPDCTPGDIDGLTLCLPSDTTSFTLAVRLDGRPISPAHVILGRGVRARSTPLVCRGADRRLQGHPTIAPDVPGVYVWTSRERKQQTTGAPHELDDELRDQLTKLGYLR
jgi:arylsulfatase A-like enzyme